MVGAGARAGGGVADGGVGGGAEEAEAGWLRGWVARWFVVVVAVVVVVVGVGVVAEAVAVAGLVGVGFCGMGREVVRGGNVVVVGWLEGLGGGEDEVGGFERAECARKAVRKLAKKGRLLVGMVCGVGVVGGEVLWFGLEGWSLGLVGGRLGGCGVCWGYMVFFFGMVRIILGCHGSCG